MINQNLNIDLIQIIENEIKYNNSIFCKVDLPFCKDLPVFKIEDFDYIFFMQINIIKILRFVNS